MNPYGSSTSWQSKDWGPRAYSYWLVASLSLFLLYLGVNTFIQPEAAIQGFGLTLFHSSDAAIIYIKANRDLYIGLVISALLLFRLRKASLILLILSIEMPIVDAILVLRSDGAAPASAWIHIGTVIYILIVAWVLFREERSIIMNHKSKHPLYFPK